MIRCQKCCSLLIEYHYGELNQSQNEHIKKHLQDCPACASALNKLKTTLETISRKERYEPDALYWDGYWDRLAHRIARKEKSGIKIVEWIKQEWQRLVFTPKWAYGTIAALAFIAVGFFIGKFYYKSSSFVTNTEITEKMSSASVQTASLEERTSRYLERSKVLLLGIVNFDAETEESYGLNFPKQQKISQDLVQEASVLKEQLNNMRLKELVIDLEIILMQIANLELEYDTSAVELIQSSIDHKGLFMKINVEEMKAVSEKVNKVHDSRTL